MQFLATSKINFLDKCKRSDHNRSASEQELNVFSDMSLEQKAAMDVEDEEFWKFVPSKWQKGVFKTKKHSYKLLDQCINQSYAVSYLTGHCKKQTSITAKLMQKK